MQLGSTRRALVTILEEGPLAGVSEARQLYGKQNHAVSLFLQRLIRLGLARKTGHGQYQKSDPSPYTNWEFCQEVDIISAA
jgi:predicted transcriptional regulator